jgi:plasmid maintenance system killer protein
MNWAETAASPICLATAFHPLDFTGYPFLYFSLTCSLFRLQVNVMIQSFSDEVTRKIFIGEELNRKEKKLLGDLRIDKAQERLAVLNQATEKDLLSLHSLHYHALQGTRRYSVDANSRNSKWRITFAWADERLTDVLLVKIEDTH